MIDSPQHTQPRLRTCAVRVRAALAVVMALSALAARPTMSQDEAGARVPDAAHGGLPLGDVVVRSTDAFVDIPSIPGEIRPDSLTTDALRRMTSHLLVSLTRDGRLMAVARVDSVRRNPDRTAWDVHISVDPGPLVRLSDVRLVGDAATRSRTAALLAGVRTGDRAGRVSLDDVRASLRGSGLFRAVGEPSYEILPDSTARLLVPVDPAPPGSFDVTIGLLPGSDPEGGPQVVGNGSIELDNAFGAGRQFDLLLDRRPGRTSHMNAGASDPFVAGYPVRVDLRFDGLQQDSTWSTRTWSAAAAYRFGISLDDLELGVRYSREVTRPGQAGLRVTGGAQRIARSDASFWGVEISIRRVDDPVSPRSGIVAESTLERGVRTFSRRIVEPSGDTTRVIIGDGRERMSLRFRGHVPLGTVLSLVAGGDVSILSADDVDESDLFRLGGASTLRGYDEDRFRGTTVGRGLIEIRSRFEERSFASAFFDLGFVDRPRIRDFPAESGWHPGFGVGVQFQAPVGLMNVSYAVGGRGGLPEGRVHVGVRFGL